MKGLFNKVNSTNLNIYVVFILRIFILSLSMLLLKIYIEIAHKKFMLEMQLDITLKW